MSEFTSKITCLLKKKDGPVWSTTPSASVFDALQLMADKQVGALAVLSNDGKLVGIFSERDYARKVILQGRTSKETSVSEIMSSPAICITPSFSVAECMQIVTEHRVRHLPVVEDDKLVGMISIGDLVNWVISEQRETIRHLEAYISGLAS